MRISPRKSDNIIIQLFLFAEYIIFNCSLNLQYFRMRFVLIKWFAFSFVIKTLTFQIKSSKLTNELKKLFKELASNLCK
jgi:hypothetical protein